MQKAKLMYSNQIKIIESKDLSEIKEALMETLYVPNVKLKARIIEELTRYLESKFLEENYKIRVFIAYNKLKVCGFVVSQIHPTYTSYGRKCGTFGWLNAGSFEVCKRLIKKCELFVKSNRIRKLRGNINFPKRFGGIGFQIMGFEAPLIYGVAFNRPESRILDYLIKLGYFTESEYTCVKVTSFSWKKGKILDKNIKIRYLTFEEMSALKEEIISLGKNSFHTILPDTTGADHGVNEIIKIYSQIPDSHYKLPEGFDFRKYSAQPEFKEAWESCDLEKVITWAPMAFDRKTDELVGIILSLPNLYQLWLEEPLTHANVDTVMVKKEYIGRGIFSSLNNIGRITTSFNGITYVEGTHIWSNNQRAIDTIFPHSLPIRKHEVTQKRI